MAKNKAPQQLVEDSKILQKGIVEMHLVWAHFEDTLATMLAEIIDSDLHLASAIIFAPTSLAARINIVDKAFTVMLDQKRLPQFNEIRPLWQKLVKKLHKLTDKRNRVAHGTIRTSNETGQQRARLTAPLFDLGRSKSGKGMSPKELTDAVEDTRQATKKLECFMSLIQHQKKADRQAYEETLLQLQG